MTPRAKITWTPAQSKIWVTTVDGSEAEITGHDEAISVVIRALEMAGAKYNDQVQVYDFGFYKRPAVEP